MLLVFILRLFKLLVLSLSKKPSGKYVIGDLVELVAPAFILKYGICGFVVLLLLLLLLRLLFKNNRFCKL